MAPQTIRSKVVKKGNSKMKGSKKNEAAVHENEVDQMYSPEDPTSGDLKVPLRQRKRPRKIPAYESDEAEEQPQTTERRVERRRAKPTVKKENKHNQSKDMMTGKSVKDGNDDVKKHSSKRTRKVPQDTVHDDATMAQSQELDSIDHADFGDNETSNCEAQLEEKDKQGKQPVVLEREERTYCEESSSRRSLVIIKAKRSLSGEYWVSSSQPTPKNLKQNKKEAKKASSPMIAKKNRAPNRSQRQSAQSSIQKTKMQNIKKGNGDKQNSNLNLKCVSFAEMEAEQMEHQEVIDLDMESDVESGEVHCSSMLLPERVFNCNSNQPFQRVYQSRCEEPEKQRRQPAGNWWLMKGASGSSQPERPQEKNNQPKQSKPGMNTLNVGNMSISPVRALLPLRRAKPVFPSKADLSSRRFMSVSDLCGPPLLPLILELKDKAFLTEWFKRIWSDTAPRVITTDHFDWYFYQGRIIGIQVDLNCGTICNGKILLWAYMRKPLWVDHRGNTVFNLLTSSVKVTINGCESVIVPAQSFMVESGEAYSIQNVTAQPAVLYFTRVFPERRN